MTNIVIILYIVLIHIENTINLEFYNFVDSDFQDFGE